MKRESGGEKNYFGDFWPEKKPDGLESSQIVGTCGL